MSDDGEPVAFDSYMTPVDELEDGQLRLLEVDNRLVLPVDTHIRSAITWS
jgi:cytochrome c oxidase subunit 2